VLLIVATWIVLGRHDVLTFQQLRFIGNQQESKERNESGVDPTAPGPSDSFHNGRRPLRMVTGWISKLKNEVKICDTVTVRVLELVERHMLLEDPADRYLFDKVCDRWNGICEEAQTEYCDRLKKGQLFQYQDEELVDQALKAIEKAKVESTSSKRERSKPQSSLEISLDGNQKVEVPAYLTSRDASRVSITAQDIDPVSKREVLQQVSSRITPHRLEAIAEKYAAAPSNKIQAHPLHSKEQQSNKGKSPAHELSRGTGPTSLHVRNSLSRPISLTTSGLQGTASPVAEEADESTTSVGPLSGTTPTNVMSSANNSPGAHQLPSAQQAHSATSPTTIPTEITEATAVQVQPRSPMFSSQPSGGPSSLTQSPGPMDPSPVQQSPPPSLSPENHNSQDSKPWHPQSISELPWEIFSTRTKTGIAKSRWRTFLSHLDGSWREDRQDELGQREMVSITEAKNVQL
jgi:hypothetical protein